MKALPFLASTAGVSSVATAGVACVAYSGSIQRATEGLKDFEDLEWSAEVEKEIAVSERNQAQSKQEALSDEETRAFLRQFAGYVKKHNITGKNQLVMCGQGKGKPWFCYMFQYDIDPSMLSEAFSEKTPELA